MSLIPSLRGSEIAEKVDRAAGLVLIEVGGPACAPCISLGPQLVALVARYQGKVELYELDPEQEVDAADAWHIRGVPTVLLLKQGKIVARWVGAQTPAVYAKEIDKQLS